MNQHNLLFHAVNKMARSPLELLEAKARASNFRIADNGRLIVIARADGSYAYQFGDVMVSRREAALRVQGRAS
jgi:hypothetical protein